MVRGSKPDEGKIFRTRLNRPRSPSSQLYNGHRIAFRVVERPGLGVDHPAPPNADVKERVGQCLYFPLWSFMACYRENLGILFIFCYLFICLVFYIFVSFIFLSFFTSFSNYFLLINSFLIISVLMAQWLRCCATNRKVAGSIPDGVIGIFH